ncbi:HlyD family type I secretion periplasmic adaptor subunit [Pseudovibrio sp. Tun.PSC04-5.I4]|uniref:HlyD family type I secretion periplasmic adaptor subunit n=1 Tax=Pseudovibrio sp. Tun.PSC04-5.I4 TaxID=1798213 RepID=UPI00087FBBD2|nr:HlyD family type I secretion periplasmic adaptor subunit [Pseudovibrio sp. Tun.PSC04-5.I4]SDR33843.1 HlyD family secretion protein [Pseudovibrio sp. Tun.PSC04-5.I4]
MSTRALVLDGSWYEDVPRTTRAPILASFVIVALTFVGFGYWASSAPMAGAIVASGSFVATGQNKIVQHFEGGIIKEILVKEGDVVSAGDVLVKLDETAAEANLERLTIRQARLQAIQARLSQEANGLKSLELPKDLLENSGEAKIKSIILNQLLTFKARMRKLQSEIDILTQGIAALKERIKGGKSQLVAVKRQAELFQEELDAKNKILSKGLIRKSDVLRIKRSLANLGGEQGRILSEIGDATERIARARAQIAKVENEASQSAVGELQVVNADLDDVREQIRAAKDVLKRVEILAPVRGIVVRMRYHTAGGVVESGKDLMEILPLQDELIIEASIQPTEIDNVKKGQKAMVRLTALNQRITPMLDAKVIYVSADALSSDNPMGPAGDVYKAHIQLDREKMPSYLNFKATPGMPAEVYITTRDRTFFDYLMEPVRDSMSRAFREP